MTKGFGQAASYVLAAAVAAAVMFGMWSFWSNESSGVDSSSITSWNESGPAPAQPRHSATSPAAAADSSELEKRADSGSAGALAAGKSEPASDHYIPIPVPGEFTEIVGRDGRLSEFHARLEREPEDPGWAQPLERELEDFLSELLDPSLIAVKLIECRSNSCEILAVGYGEHAVKAWFEMSRALYESGLLEKWFQTENPGQFQGGCGGFDLGPGVTGLNCEFSRTVGEDPASPATFSLTEPYPDGIEFQPVPVPADFVSLYETNAEVYEFHRAMEMEAIDHSWASFIENQVAEHFAAIPELEPVNYHHLECRSTRCEIQLTIPDEQTAINWTLELGNFDDEPWHDLEYTIYNVPADDDLIRIVWLLWRGTGPR